MQCSVHLPSAFISSHQTSLLPTWSRPVGSVLLVLQPCVCELLGQSAEIEQQKQQLRTAFLAFGAGVADRLEQLGHLAEVFDPRSGQPSRSCPGALVLDDVAVVKSCLDYPITPYGDCWGIVHPAWGSAVYPSTLLSSAEPAVVQAVCEQIMTRPSRLTK